MPHVISEIVEVQRNGETLRMPKVAADLGCSFACSDGAFEIPPDVPAHNVPSEYVVVALRDSDHEAAVTLGFVPVVSLDPCEVSD